MNDEHAAALLQRLARATVPDDVEATAFEHMLSVFDRISPAGQAGATQCQRDVGSIPAGSMPSNVMPFPKRANCSATSPVALSTRPSNSPLVSPGSAKRTHRHSVARVPWLCAAAFLLAILFGSRWPLGASGHSAVTDRPLVEQVFRDHREQHQRPEASLSPPAIYRAAPSEATRASEKLTTEPVHRGTPVGVSTSRSWAQFLRAV